MDWVRSCYRTKVRFSADPSAPPVEIQWFFVDDQPLVFLPFYTKFASGNWASDHTCPSAWPGPGEISPWFQDRKWVNGARLVSPRCSGNPIGTASQFAGNITWPWTPLAANACCNTARGFRAVMGMSSTVTYSFGRPVCFDGIGFVGPYAGAGGGFNFNSHVSIPQSVGNEWDRDFPGTVVPGPPAPFWTDGPWELAITNTNPARLTARSADPSLFPLPRTLTLNPFFSPPGFTPPTITLYWCDQPPAKGTLKKLARLSSLVAYSPRGPVTGSLPKKIGVRISSLTYAPFFLVSGRISKLASVSSAVNYTRPVAASGRLRKSLSIRTGLVFYDKRAFGSLPKEASMSSSVSYVPFFSKTASLKKKLVIHIVSIAYAPILSLTGSLKVKLSMSSTVTYP